MTKLALSNIIFLLTIENFVLGNSTGLTGAVTSTITGAFSWRSVSPSSWFTSYDCGDDLPDDIDYVLDLSDCVNDTEATKNYLFCYLNNTETISKLSPKGVNDDCVQYWQVIKDKIYFLYKINEHREYGAQLLISPDKVAFAAA